VAQGTRVIARMSADAASWAGRLALMLFKIMDSIMARRQLIGLRERAGCPRPDDTETSARDQFQLYWVLYASGATADVVGEEQSAGWRATAIADGVIEP
jgi:hypothetical protein